MEEVKVEQPLGFENSDFLNYVYNHVKPFMALNKLLKLSMKD